MNYSLGFIFGLSAAFFWALGNYIYKDISSEKNALALNFYKTTLALIIIAPFSLTIGSTGDFLSQETLLILLSGALGIGLGDTFFLRPWPY